MRVLILFSLCLLLNSCHYSIYVEATNHTEEPLVLESGYHPATPLKHDKSAAYQPRIKKSCVRIEPLDSERLEFLAANTLSLTVKNENHKCVFRLFARNHSQLLFGEAHYKQSNSRRFLPISKAGRVKTYYFDIRADKDKGIYLQSGRGKLWPESREKIVK